MNTKRKLVALLAIATLVSIVNASVFVYYPISLTISPQQPPVVFQGGSNANGTDLWGKTISVTVSNEGTSLSIVVHPTLQRNYYYNIAKIKNNDGSRAYYIKFKVTESISDSRVSSACLIINGNKIDLRDSDLQPNDWIELSALGEFRVDLYLELSRYSDSDITVSVDLIITTTKTGETPPIVPP